MKHEARELHFVAPGLLDSRQIKGFKAIQARRRPPVDTKDLNRDFSARAGPAGLTLRAGEAGRLEAAGSRGAVPSAPPGGGQAFRRQLQSLSAGASGAAPGPAQPDASTVTVRRGDTLTSLVRTQWALRGGAAEDLSPQQAHRWALQVAKANGLSDPDRILPGQTLRVDPQAAAVAKAPRGPEASPPVALPLPIVRVDRLADGARLHPLLNQTLDRAVDLGYIPAVDRENVGQRIATLADKHGFTPDDFAKAVLMESDGLNPRASNGSCHGIIQFCSGPDRGAASAGYGQRPRDILGLSVLQQLDLVDRYFDDTKLREFRGRDGRVRLDDLYLTILTPAARQERSLTAPLPIAGPQALDLHVKRERSSPITRSSILAGLNINARQRLGQLMVADLALR